MQAAEILAMSVILSGAKNLDANKISMLRDSSSPAAPQNDIFGDFCSRLLKKPGNVLNVIPDETKSKSGIQETIVFSGFRIVASRLPE